MWKRHFISPLGLVRRAVVALAAIAVVACGGSADDPPPATPTAPPVTPAVPQAAPARIEIAPETVLLTAPGARKALVAQVFDAAGNPVTASVEWNSSRPAAVSIDAAGVVTAAGTVGSSQVTARIGTLSSAPMLVVHTTVPVGTVLLTDAQITGDLVETDPDAPPGVGNTYVARLVGVAAPAVGQLIMNTESKPVAGRVTAVESVGGEHRVTLALVPATEMFPDLVLDEAIDLNRAEVEIPPALRDQYDISRDGNTFTFTPKPGKFVLAGAPPDGRATNATARPQSTALPVGTTALPPFTKCEATLLGAGGDATLPVGLSLPPTFAFTLNNRLDVKYASATGLERFVIHGEPNFTVNGGLKATIAFEGKVTCEAELLIIRIPVGGPLSLIIGGLVPVGVGLEFGGKITAASMGLSTSVSAKTSFDVGIGCPGGGDCSLINEFGPLDLKVIPTIDLPGLGDLRVEPGLSAYGFAKASIGNPFLKKLRFDALGVKAGAALRGSFAPMSTQIADAAYKSDYKLLTELRAGAGTELSGLAAMLGLGAITGVDLLLSTTLASSPLGTVDADKSAFVRGDTVNFSVRLDPTKLEFPPAIGSYNVKQIVLVRRIDITTQQEVARITAANGQAEFTIPFVADNGGRADEFFAFVVTSLLPVDPLALEIGRAASLAEAVNISTSGGTSGTIGLPFNLALSATGGTGTYVWSVSSGDLPDGLSLNPSTGVISGTPARAGTFDVTIRATSGSAIGERTLGFTIGSNVARLTVGGGSDTGPVLVSTTSLGIGQVGRPFRARLLAQGASSGEWTGRVTSNPAGIDCVLTESSTAGTCSFDFPIGTRVRLLATDEGKSTFVRWSSACGATGFFVGFCTVTMSQSGTVGASFRNGNWETIRVNSSDMPKGLALDPVTGIIEGTPTEAINATLRFRSSGGGSFDESPNILIEIRP